MNANAKLTRPAALRSMRRIPKRAVILYGFFEIANSDLIYPLVGCSFLSDDQQSHVGNDIEDQKDDFEKPEGRVHDHVEGFSGNWKPFALRTVHQIRGQYTNCGPEYQQGPVYDCTPHKECC